MHEVRVLHQVEDQAATFVLLYLLRSWGGQPEVGDGGGHDQDIGLTGGFEDGGTHLSHVAHEDTLNTVGRRQGIRGRDKGNPGATVAACLGDGIAHFAARAIADGTDGIDGLTAVFIALGVGTLATAVLASMIIPSHRQVEVEMQPGVALSEVVD